MTEFIKTIRTSLNCVVNDFFHVEAYVEKIDGFQENVSWNFFIYDYDSNMCAEGGFHKEEDFTQNFDKLMEQVSPAYTKKYAKFGKMPTFTFVDGEWKMKLVEW